MTWHQRTYAPTNVLLVALLGLVAGSCASSGRTVEEGETGDLVVLTTVPAEESEGVSDGGDPRPDPGATGDSLIAPGPDFDSLVAVIRSEAAEPRERSVLPFGVTWT
ncbi:MAG: hypothetical protein WBP17_01475, partial [Gemmatimonadota bacterium]